MIRINLLPREEIPTQRSFKMPQLGSLAPLVLVIFVVAGLAAVATYQGRKISNLQEVIAQEEAETRRLAPEIAKIKRLNTQRQDLNGRLDVITELDKDRYFRVHLLDEINRSLPDHMWLTRLDDLGGNRYAVEGVTFSNFLVSDLMQNLNRSPYFTAVDLKVAEKGTIHEVQVVKFRAETVAVWQPEVAPYGG